MARIGIDVRKFNDFGIGTYVRNLVDQLASPPTENQLVLFHKPGEDAGLPETCEKVVENAGLYSAGELFSLGQKARASKLDLLHMPHYVMPYGAGCRLAVTIHDLIHLLFPEYLSLPKSIYARHFLSRAASKSDVIFTDSQNSKKDIIEHLGADDDKVIVSYCGVGDSFFGASEKKISSEEAPYLLYVGNNKPHKNLITALKAFSYFRKRGHEEWQFLLAGGSFSNAKTGAEILNTVESLGLADSVHFSGYLSENELISVYQSASMFIFPSLYEGFGLPPLEAMASGVPVVSSNASAMPEILGDAALFVEPLDDVMMCEQMLKLAESETLRKEMIAKGRLQAKQYSWGKTMTATVSGYEKALNK
jgi:glycosyltransferase involved in cell wall biosynthesis